MNFKGTWLALCVAAVMPQPSSAATLYVDSASSGAAAPYATWATAATDIQTALGNVSSGDEIVIAAGNYTLANEIRLDSAITLRGETGDANDVTILAAPGKRLFRLGHAGAHLEALTLSGGRPASGNGGCVLIDSAGGMVTNCILRDGVPQGWGASGGGFAIEAKKSAAIVANCVISGCNASLNGNGVDDRDRGGTGAYVASGNVRNCLFTGNGSTATASNSGGTILLHGGTVANCTIAGNANYYHPGIVAHSGVAVNCLIGANTNVYSDCVTALAASGTLSCLTNCLTEMVVNDWCLASTRLFRNAPLGDWRPAATAIDAGAPLDWLAGASDLSGNVRVAGAAPDIGCFEADTSLFSVTATPSATTGVVPFALTLSFDIFGATGKHSYDVDWEGNGVYERITEGAETASHIYSTPGDYAVGIRAKDSASPYATDSVAIMVRPATIYVDKSSASPVFPYAASGTAATTVADALAAAVDGCAVEIAADTYGIPAELQLTKAVSLRGATGNPEDVILNMQGNKHRIVYMGNAGARLEGVAVQGGHLLNNTTPYSKNGSGICIGPTGGTVSNCIVRGCDIYTWGCDGAGIYIFNGADNAVVTHCVISNCVRATSSSESGVALAMYGGNVRNCLFTGNAATANNAFQTHAMGTVRIGGGTLENCTIANNSSYNCSGVYATGGRVINCAIGLNTSDCLSGDTNHVVWAGTAECFTNCIAPILINGWCIAESEAHTYRAPAAGDFSILPTSAAFDAGATLGWMAGATDLAGNPRVRGDAPDIGAYEADAEALSISIAATTDAMGFAPLAVSFVAQTANATGAVIYHWDWDGDGMSDETTSSAAVSHTFSTCGFYRVGLSVIAGNGGSSAPSPVFVKVAPRVIYVDSSCENPSPPYDTWINAATDIQTAADYAIPGCEIVLAKGIYGLKAPIIVDKAVWIRGATDDPADVLVRNTVTKALDGTSTCRVFTLSGTGAKLSSVTVADGYIGNNTTDFSRDGGGLYIGGQGVVVSNCIVRNCFAWYWGSCGGGVFIAPTAIDALLTHCVISNCQNTASHAMAGNFTGAALFMQNGTARNCLFTGNNTPAASPTSNSYTVFLQAGVVENCTIAANLSGGPAGLRCVPSETTFARNVIIAGNESTGNQGPYTIYDPETHFVSCLTDDTLIFGNDSCRQAPVTEIFKDFAAGDFRITAASPAANKGVLFDWMDGATDLSGNPRVFGKKPDIGCYECQASTPTLLIMR